MLKARSNLNECIVWIIETWYALFKSSGNIIIIARQTINTLIRHLEKNLNQDSNPGLCGYNIVAMQPHKVSL